VFAINAATALHQRSLTRVAAGVDHVAVLSAAGM